MLNYEIGLSGLRVAQRALEYIGTNIANAGTEGYHRQDLKLVPRELGSSPGLGAQGELILGGVEIASAMRAVDLLVEAELVRQQPLLGQTTRELDTLQLIENSLGGTGNCTLSVAVSGFFNSLAELASDPNSQALQEQAARSADAMAAEFQNLRAFLTELQENIRTESEQAIGEVNRLAGEIASLNQEASEALLRNKDANLLVDRRDQAVKELADWVEVRTNGAASMTGMLDVAAWGWPAAAGGVAGRLEIGDSDGLLGISPEGTGTYDTTVSGGRLGGLLALHNTIVPGITDALDSLAEWVIDSVNAVHAQGVGTAGSFGELTGWVVGAAATPLSQVSANITDGRLWVRITDTQTGATASHALDVPPAGQTLDDYTLGELAADMDSLTGISASISADRLRVQADAGYVFDFLPASTAELTPPQWSAGNTAGVKLSGFFGGDANDDLTVTVAGASGAVGVTADLRLVVRNSAGEIIKTVNVGSGYAAGDALDLGSGLSVALSAGDLVSGDSFTIRALTASDTAGVLAATGLNSLLIGTDASNIAVNRDVLNDPSRLAASLTAPGADNINLRRMVDLGTSHHAALGGITPHDYINQIVGGVAQDVAARKARQTSLEAVHSQLIAQRDAISGVDVNEEAAKLMIFEKMFQAMAKVMSTQNNTMDALMSLL